VCDRKRLGAVHAFLRRKAIPTQYSVFVAFMSHRQIHTLVAALETLTCSIEDDVRVYPVPALAEVFMLGATLMPEGVSLPDEQLVQWLR
jgi:CRISPR/Cas system-associated endoribonuclease Cas2